MKKYTCLIFILCLGSIGIFSPFTACDAFSAGNVCAEWKRHWHSWARLDKDISVPALLTGKRDMTLPNNLA